jgi:hypothetical protein
MIYTLTEKHYNSLPYFIKDSYKDNIYNIDNDNLVGDFKKELIVKVLNYYIYDNLDFINKDNYIKVFEIFFHYGSEIGYLFRYNNGCVIKNLNILKEIDLVHNSDDNFHVTHDCKIIKGVKYDKNDYGKVVQFNRDIYNYENKLKYGKLFDLYFDKLEFNMDILDYDNYDIKCVKIYETNNLEKYKNDYKINICLSKNKKSKSKLKSTNYDTDKKLSSEKIKDNFLEKLPKSLTHLNLSGDFNQEIKKNILPKSLTHLILGDNFNQEIKEGVLPNSLKYLSFGYKYNKKININVLPKSLIQLKFDFECEFKYEIKPNVLPNSLKYLILNGDYNYKIIKNVLPQSLTHFTFGGMCDYNYKIEKDILPPSLTHLTFNGGFDQKIEEGVLPPSLTHLNFDDSCFNQIIEPNVLPKLLKCLHFNESYNQKIEFNVLPESLEVLHIGCSDYYCYDHKIEKNVLPKSLKIIYTDPELLDKSYINISKLQIFPVL